MRLRSCVFVLTTAWAVSVQAHSMFTSMFVNGEGVGDGTCIRIDDTATTAFVEDITSNEMSCGATGLKKVERTCPIKAGDVISFKWKNHPGNPDSEVIVASHNGTCAVYMKQMATGDPAPDGSFPDASPAGDGWFKILYDDKDDSGRWCIDRLRTTAAGVISVKIPNDVKPGYYLLRPELLALHQAKDGQPQFYVGCAQVYISGGTGTANPETASIPGYVDMSMPQMTFNIFDPKAGPYPGFGPALYKSDENSVAAVASSNQLPDLSGQPSSTAVTSALPTQSYSVELPPSASSVATSIPLGTFSTVILPTTTVVAAQAQTSPAAPSTSTCTGRKARRHAREVISKVLPRQSPSNPFACPSGTVLEIGNLCLPEVPAWNDTDDSMTNCLASYQKCLETTEFCRSKTNAAVDNHSGHGCYLYDYKCRAIKKACNRKVKQGPVDIGKVVTEVKPTVGGWGIMI